MPTTTFQIHDGVLAVLEIEQTLYLELLEVACEQGHNLAQRAPAEGVMATLVGRRELIYSRLHGVEESKARYQAEFNRPSDQVRLAASAIILTIRAVLAQDRANQRLFDELFTDSALVMSTASVCDVRKALPLDAEAAELVQV